MSLRAILEGMVKARGLPPPSEADHALSRLTRTLFPPGVYSTAEMAQFASGIEVGVRLATRHPEYAARLLEKIGGAGNEGVVALEIMVDGFVRSETPPRQLDRRASPGGTSGVRPSIIADIEASRTDGDSHP